MRSELGRFFSARLFLDFLVAGPAPAADLGLISSGPASSSVPNSFLTCENGRQYRFVQIAVSIAERSSRFRFKSRPSRPDACSAGPDGRRLSLCRTGGLAGTFRENALLNFGKNSHRLHATAFLNRRRS